jgi:hypothetical protein
MKNQFPLATLAAIFFLTTEHVVWAQPILSTDPEPTYMMEARARNGASGYEGVLFTPGDPSPGTGFTQLNPVGAPAWTYNQFHAFSFQYNPVTGNAVWQIDFNRDGDFLDAEETTNSTSPTLVNYGFQYVNVWMQGNNVPSLSVTVQNLTINGVNFGSYSSTGSSPTSVLFEETSGRFSNITVTGSLRFSGGSGQERPRLYIRMGALVVLPVQLTGFSVSSTELGPEIRWQSDNEYGIDYYEIHRSQDGRSFEPIGKLPARNLPGRQSYRFLDRESSAGKYFYRLRIADADGSFTHSNILLQETRSSGPAFRYYPNPARESVSIVRKDPGPALLQIYQLDGALRFQKNLEHAAETISLSGWKPGVYLLVLRQSQGDVRERLLIQ